MSTDVERFSQISGRFRATSADLVEFHHIGGRIRPLSSDFGDFRAISSTFGATSTKLDSSSTHAGHFDKSALTWRCQCVGQISNGQQFRRRGPATSNFVRSNFQSPPPPGHGCGKSNPAGNIQPTCARNFVPTPGQSPQTDTMFKEASSSRRTPKSGRQEGPRRAAPS